MEATYNSDSLTRSIAQFEKDGFVVLPIEGLQNRLERVRAELFSVFDVIRFSSDGKRVASDQDVIEFCRENQARQYQAVKIGYHMPSLYGVVDHTSLITTLKTLGVRHPILDLEPQIRCDMPIRNQSVFKQHQDWTYNIGSKNAVTAWIPLQDTSIDEGAPRVAPGSQKQGVYPHDKGVIRDQYRFKFVDTTVKFGEALILDQKVVHESCVNKSDKIRFSIQVRYSDIEDDDYASRGWPRNHIRQSSGFALPTIIY